MESVPAMIGGALEGDGLAVPPESPLEGGGLAALPEPPPEGGGLAGAGGGADESAGGELGEGVGSAPLPDPGAGEALKCGPLEPGPPAPGTPLGGVGKLERGAAGAAAP